MRSIVPIALVLATLSACGGDPQEPSEASGEAVGQADAAIDEDRVTLLAEGLVVGGETLYFPAGRSEVETALERRLGPAEVRSSSEECGAGPMKFTEFPGGLKVNFQDGGMVGWMLQGSDEDVQLALANGLAIGAPRDGVAALPGYQPVAQSTLGDEFTIGTDPVISGLFGEDRVETLWAGANCIFR